MMNLMTGLLGLGGHLGGWRHKDAWSENVMNLDHCIWTAKEAERGLFDLLFLADGNADFAKAAGLEFDASAGGLGLRSKRYSMLVENGTVKSLSVEQVPSQVEVSSADAMLKAL